MNVLRRSLAATAFVAIVVTWVVPAAVAQTTDTTKTDTKKSRRKKTDSTAAPAPAAAPTSTTSKKAASAPTPTASASDIAAAKASGKVWVNTETKVYHKDGKFYGATKKGKFMNEADAQKAGYRASKGN